jgi:hypothetical protein
MAIPALSASGASVSVPVLDEILRARLPIRPDVLRRWQHEIREIVQPLLQEREELLLTARRPKKSTEAA